ncbi:MAG: N-acetyltransferase [Phycisphaerales bacterium]|nr:N-acetyltransferase [Phycisphaerales bacterium]
MHTIRPTSPGDFEAIANLTNHYIRHTAVHFGYQDVTAQDFEQAWRETHNTYPWLTAELDGRFAGYAKAGVWRERAAYKFSAETAIYIEDFAYRTGIARALYQTLLDELKARGFHTAVAGATLPNDVSVRFHEAMGFKTIGTFREVGRKFDQWHDVIFWQKML